VLERQRMESELSDLEVIAPDERQRVPFNRTLVVPNRWVCWLRIPNTAPADRSFGSGSGVLVGPRHVLTAAHVLVDEADPGKTVGSRLRVQIAANGQDAPFAEVGVRGWQVDPRWLTRVGGRWRALARFDYALVTLDREVSGASERRLGSCTLSHWGAARCGHGSTIGIPAAGLAERAGHVTGYPHDKPTGTMWTGAGRVRLDRTRNVLVHTVDTKGGQSGSPVWCREEGGPRLVGIHSRPGALVADGSGAYADNVAAPLTPDVVTRIQGWQRTYAR
jgi:V8-like Glu-specific endopeptidase